MKGKLIKTVDGYELFTQGFLKGSTSYGLIESLNIEEGPIRYKLSLENCQAIEGGYDLDELTENFWKQEFIKPGIIDTNSFKQGFQKALELMGDKKFSEEDIEKAIEFGHKTYHSWKDRNEEKFIQSLQQTEWEVEIEMEKVLYSANMPKEGESRPPIRPKLDATGCLILKRI